jgi:hypothetical protein
MVVMDLAQSLWRDVEKKQKNPVIFGHAPLSTGIRCANVVSSSHLVYCRGSTMIIGGNQGVWEEDLCGCCMLATVRGCNGEFLVVFEEFSI